jgi:hypothetical protein
MENRWWEFYLVRYLIGTIIGVLIISYLIFQNDVLSKLIINQDSTSTRFELLKDNYWVFILIGFAFCYISSAPILVLHTCRAYFKDEKGGLNTKSKCIAKIIYLFIFISLSISLFQVYFCWLPWFLFFTIVIFQSILIIYSFSNQRVYDFYDSLTKSRKREKNKENSRDNYIESYKHLREHGNAFSILITEFSLGFILINLESINQIITVLSLWILPAMYVWLIGTSLEFRVGVEDDAESSR